MAIAYGEHQHQYLTSSDLEKYEDEEVDKDEFEVEKFMMDGIHFSHHHPLQSLVISASFEEDDDDHSCRICGLPIFVSTPAYTCNEANNACKFFLHQQCALKLPPKLIHPTHRADFNDDVKHILHMVIKSSTFTYDCDECDFSIHPLVAVNGIEIKLKHKIHLLHQMVAVCRRISSECDVCGKIQDGFFFSCQDCNFWIHQDCTILPNMIMIPTHPHPFILACSLPLNLIDRFCVVCGRKLFLTCNGIYLCPQSMKFAHVVCGIEKKATSKTRLELMQLPDDDMDAFPSAVIRRYAESNRLGRDGVKSNYEKLVIMKHHNHPLSLTDDQVLNNINLASCDLCAQRIPMSSSPISFYACGDHDCHFVAHKICVDILPILKFSIPGFIDESGMACHYPSRLFCSIFVCFFCCRPCNGLCYHLPRLDEDQDMPMFIDLECMVVPTTVNHASHTHNVLFRTHRLSDATPLTCCPDKSYAYDVYRCIVCEYYIHIRCAMLPKRTFYPQYHHHPLHLLFTGNGHEYEYEDSSFCEVCEEDIDLKYWFYRCCECDQSFHINCIPTVGFLSKVKFGKTFSLPDNHSHPLKLKQMLAEHSQRCGQCKEIIQGLVDEMAFFCSRCHFWLHFFCAAPAYKATSDEFNFFFEFRRHRGNRRRLR